MNILYLNSVFINYNVIAFNENRSISNIILLIILHDIIYNFKIGRDKQLLCFIIDPKRGPLTLF